jgi:hypothetical protein
LWIISEKVTKIIRIQGAMDSRVPVNCPKLKELRSSWGHAKKLQGFKSLAKVISVVSGYL